MIFEKSKLLGYPRTSTTAVIRNLDLDSTRLLETSAVIFCSSGPLAALFYDRLVPAASP